MRLNRSVRSADERDCSELGHLTRVIGFWRLPRYDGRPIRQSYPRERNTALPL